MSINAYARFMEAIEKKLEMFGRYNTRLIKDFNELNDCTKTLSGIGYSIGEINNSTRELLINQTDAIEVTFENGLICLWSCIHYIDKKTGNYYTIVQNTLTTNYEEPPKINISYEHKSKAIQQLLVHHDSKDSFFEDDENKIDVEISRIYIGNFATDFNLDYYMAYFTTFTQKSTDQLLLERYQHISPDSYQSSFLLNCGKDELEIMYDCNKPVYCQFSKNRKIGKLGIALNEGAEEVIGEINQEIEFYILAIDKFLEEIDKRYRNSIKKKTKKNSD